MPRFTHVHDLVPPDPPDVCEIAIFPVAAVPFALAALEHRIPIYVWSEAGYARGVQLIRSMQLAILCGGVKEITDRLDNLYRLHAGALYGTEYSVVSSDPELVIEPAIQAYHALDFENENSLLGRAEDLRQLLQNGINGTETPLYDRADGIRDLLELIKTALETESGIDSNMLAKLAEIAVLVA
jgi:hypothetical protein